MLLASVQSTQDASVSAGLVVAALIAVGITVAALLVGRYVK